MRNASSINILLADDDEDDCLLLKEALEELRMNTRLTTVSDGEKLMQLLTNRAEEPFDILFLDLNMPRKNGFACLEEIRRGKNLEQLSVVILSTSYDENIADLLYKKGAHHYICKPADFSKLKKLIEYALHLVTKDKASQPPKEQFLLHSLTSI